MDSIFIFGRTPPPIGGVTKSVQNTLNAFKHNNIRTALCSARTLFSFNRYDIAHVHYLKRWKIIIAILLGKIYAKKTVLTYHGSDFYPDRQWLDRLIYKLLDGVVVLNALVFNRCAQRNTTKTILLTPVFQEGLAPEDSPGISYFTKESGKKYILLYASRKDVFNGVDVYGCYFIFSLLEDLPRNSMLVFLDPHKSYAEDVKTINTERVIYIDHPVDFTALLLSVDIYIRPTNRDGSSIAILEALSANTPVLASDVVDRGEGVVTYAHNSSKDFIRKLKEILSDSTTSDERHLSSIHEFEAFCDRLLHKDTSCAV